MPHSRGGASGSGSTLPDHSSRDFPILILDEFTSALNMTLWIVPASLPDFRKGKTTLVVSHHPQVLADADRVILLE